nr:immunoglobulin light chain junction region [Macaca mulatta]
CQKYSTSPYTC